MSRLKTIADYMRRGSVTIQEQGFAWQLNDEDREAVIKALEKQETKKPEIIEDEKGICILRINCGECGAGIRPLQAYCDSCEPFRELDVYRLQPI